jgi:NADH-quinone oxidoreductase subunit C
MSINKAAEKFIEEKFSTKILEKSDFRNELTFIVGKDDILDILQFLYDDTSYSYNFLTDITATDWPKREQRHEVVYLLFSFKDNTRVRFKVRLKEGEKIPTASVIWDSANWLEREVFDLFGVHFEGHPDLTKIVTADDLEGHPLQKDFSLTYEQPHFSHNKDLPPEVS